MPKIFKDKNDNVLYTGYETSEVVANPTLAGTEADLTGVQIGSTKYKVPEGFSGNYNDLTNKPTIPAAVSGINDGTNWTSITIGDTTKAIPQGGGSTNLISEAEFYYAINDKTINYSKFLQLLTSKDIDINEDISSDELRIRLNIREGDYIEVGPYNTESPLIYRISCTIRNNNFEAVDTNNSSTLIDMVWDNQLGPLEFFDDDYYYTNIIKPNIVITSFDTLITFISDITIGEVIELFDDAN